ncbi:MAG: type II toxin-antitoxin system PrlF family antitoxin [Desulfurivibrio sp.]|nr:type II toxin-antitoxin system PrlF family antitoxin [Desulfurivibrio sp.]
MTATLEVESTLTDRYQTTVPETVRRTLQLGKRDKIHYTIRPGGEVVLSRVEPSEKDDPVLGRFLASWPATSPVIRSACRPLMPASCSASSR